MSTDARIYDINHLSREDLEAIAGRDMNGKYWQSWAKAYDLATNGDCFEIGSDEFGASDFRIAVEYAIRYDGIKFLSRHNIQLILIWILRAYEVDKNIETFINWETQWEHPDRNKLIELMEWLDGKEGHWIFLTC